MLVSKMTFFLSCLTKKRHNFEANYNKNGKNELEFDSYNSFLSHS